MTRKKNAEPCPRCKLIRQEWRRGLGYSQSLSVKGEGIYHNICHRCAWLIGAEVWRRTIATEELRRFAENEMWSLESGALT